MIISYLIVFKQELVSSIPGNKYSFHFSFYSLWDWFNLPAPLPFTVFITKAVTFFLFRQKIPLALLVENVYRIGLREELSGRTKTAIHRKAILSGSLKPPVRDNMLIIIIGIQQQKSVITMKTSRLAMADS